MTDALALFQVGAFLAACIVAGLVVHDLLHWAVGRWVRR